MRQVPALHGEQPAHGVVLDLLRSISLQKFSIDLSTCGCSRVALFKTFELFSSIRTVELNFIDWNVRTYDFLDPLASDSSLCLLPLHSLVVRDIYGSPRGLYYVLMAVQESIDIAHLVSLQLETIHLKTSYARHMDTFLQATPNIEQFRLTVDRKAAGGLGINWEYEGMYTCLCISIIMPLRPCLRLVTSSSGCF